MHSFRQQLAAATRTKPVSSSVLTLLAAGFRASGTTVPRPLSLGGGAQQSSHHERQDESSRSTSHGDGGGGGYGTGRLGCGGRLGRGHGSGNCEPAMLARGIKGGDWRAQSAGVRVPVSLRVRSCASTVRAAVQYPCSDMRCSKHKEPARDLLNRLWSLSCTFMLAPLKRRSSCASGPEGTAPVQSSMRYVHNSSTSHCYVFFLLQHRCAIGQSAQLTPRGGGMCIRHQQGTPMARCLD